MSFDAGSPVFVCSSCINYKLFFVFKDPFGNRLFLKLQGLSFCISFCMFYGDILKYIFVFQCVST